MFKKGQKVVWFVRWDDKGKYRIERAIVQACGKKRMVLEDEKGVCLGRKFVPAERQYGKGFVFADMPKADAEARAMELAAEWIGKERARFEEILARDIGGPAYKAAIARDLERVKAAEPAFFWK